MDACRGVRAQALCRSVRLPGGEQIRYAVLQPSSDEEASPARGATVVDLGGPGVALFGANWPGAALQAVTDRLRTPIVVLDEPWTRTPYPAGCRRAASDWFTALHSGLEAPSARFATTCRLGRGLWGWTPESYREAVDAALDQEGLSFARFVGASFAGVRLSYLHQPPPEVVLVSPYPLGQSSSAYVETRVAAVAAFCRARPGSSSCTGRARIPAEAKRSLDVTEFDLGAAWIGTSYQRDPTAYRELLAGDPDAGVVGALSDAVTGRFGVTDVSPSTFAYFDEVCSSFGTWRPGVGGDLAAKSFLLSWHDVCRQVPAPARPRDPQTLESAHVCVVTYRRDGVVPSVASQGYWGARADVHEVLPGPSHGVIDAQALSACT